MKNKLKVTLFDYLMNGKFLYFNEYTQSEL